MFGIARGDPSGVPLSAVCLLLCSKSKICGFYWQKPQPQLDGLDAQADNGMTKNHRRQDGGPSG
jgi:hypothetical protein